MKVTVTVVIVVSVVLVAVAMVQVVLDRRSNISSIHSSTKSGSICNSSNNIIN